MVTEARVRTVCPHDCPDMCSIIATVRDGRLVAVAGDPDQPFTNGFLCGKVRRYPERVHSPHRLLTPLRRTGPKGAGQFTPISWDAALTEITERWQQVQAAYGPEALLGYAYSGNQGIVNRNIVRALFHALGASRLIAGTVCDTTCAAGWTYALGNTPDTDPETVVDSDFILCWGANLVTTNVHMVPLVDAARDRGAQLVVIDPYRTRTARRADRHFAPRIGTDTALALGMMHVLARDGIADAAFIAARTTGWERLRDEVLPRYTPEAVAAITGLPAADIEWLGRRYGEARAPFLRVGMGMSRHWGGGMATRTVALLPAVVGAWGKPGGGALLHTSEAWTFNFNALRRPDLMARPTREINHSTLGRDLLELRDPPVMALYVSSNNPAVTCPDQRRMTAGLAREDLFTVVHDSFLTDTARFADIVLPATTAMESEDLFRSYGSYYLQHSAPVLEPIGEARSNLWLTQQLARRLGLADPVFTADTGMLIDAALTGAGGVLAGLSPAAVRGAGPIKVNAPQDGPPVTFFFSEQMARDGLPPLPEWQPDPQEPPAGSGQLRLLTLPGHAQHHSAFAGVAALRRRAGPATAVLHPDDAGQRGIRDGGAVLLANANGEAGVRCRVSDETLPGTVAVEGSPSREDFLCGGPFNVLVSDRLADMGGGATYQSTWVTAAPMSE